MKLLEDMNEPELTKLMQLAAKSLEDSFRVSGAEKPHFVLVVFNDPKIAQYISNCRRSDIIQAMRETADRLERKQDVTR
jgi:hypothetical protein